MTAAQDQSGRIKGLYNLESAVVSRYCNHDGIIRAFLDLFKAR
jgi:hypothetical protein